MRTIGLIGGMSWESSLEYYRLINQQVRDRLGPLRSAQLLMYSVDFGPVEQAQHAGRWDDTAAILVDAARRLEAGGGGICFGQMKTGQRCKPRGWQEGRTR
jgi:aspartate racemase